MTNKNSKKGVHSRFIESWFMGMNDYEIAKQIGVNINTLRNVKKDLSDDQTE